MDDNPDNLETISDVDDDLTNAIIPTAIIIKFAKDIQPYTLRWIIGKINGKRRDGGAELIVRKEQCLKNQGLTLHVSASKIKLLQIAEETELVKRDKLGQMREFTVAQLEDFFVEGKTISDVLTTAERSKLIRHELENIRALAEDEHVPGYPLYKLYEGQSLIEVCLQQGLITNIYLLHDQKELNHLANQWYRKLEFTHQPIEAIRSYFGEAIALYFSFLGYYTTALIVPMGFGMVQTFLFPDSTAFFCVFNVIWTTVFLEVWKRKCTDLAYKWGTISMTSLDEPRANFRGQMGVDPVTKKVTPQYPRWKTYAKMYCVSIPIVLVCLGIGFFVMLVSFWVENHLKITLPLDYEHRTYMLSLPSIIYAGVVYVMNFYYRKFATRLTEWENHRTQSQFDRHRVTKLILFEFVNNFMCLFYIAFVIQDMEMLQYQLITMLIILQIFNNVQEALLPYVMRVYFKGFFERPIDANQQHESEDVIFDTLETIPTIYPTDPIFVAAQSQGMMEEYEGTYDDYLEMFMQFGYVVLFSSVYPMAAFWAFINNVIEIRADAFKLCRVFQRPIARKVKDIGAWQKAFEILGALSIMTNCGLLALNPRLRGRAPTYSDFEWILLFALIEHVLLAIRYILHIVIPDKSSWVREALARQNYESKQALKHERMQKSHRILLRRFKTVHGPYKNSLNSNTV